MEELIIASGNKKVIKMCDLVSLFGFYVTAFFIPIAPAIIETAFVFIILPYLVARVLILVANLNACSKHYLILSFEKSCRLFIEIFKPVDSFINKPLFWYTFIAFSSLAVSHYPHLSVKGFIFKLLQGVFFCLLLINTINTKKRLNLLLIVFLSSVGLVSFDGIFQYIIRADFIQLHLILDGRVTSSLKHGNDFGAYLVAVIPILLCVLLFVKSNKNSPDFFSLKWKITVLVIFILSLLCLGLTYSRSSWLAFFASFFIVTLKKPKIFVLFFILLLLFAVIFIPKMLKERTTNIVSENGIFETSERLQYWCSAIPLIINNPLIGVGLNTYSMSVKEYNVYWTGYPHNCYLQMAAEIGILGLLAFLWMLLRLFKVSLANFNKISSSLYKNILLGALAGLFGFLVQSFFDTSFYSVQLDALLWLILGLIVTIQKLHIQ